MDKTWAAGIAFCNRNKWPLVVGAFVVFAFLPFIFLRYEFHDSWAWLYWLNSLRVFNFVTPCLELGGHHYMIGRPLMSAILCAMTAFGPEIDLVWIPKLFALLLLFGAGALVLSIFRSVGSSVALGSLALGSLLFLPGFILMIVMMVANAIAWAVFAAVLAGLIWWKLSCQAKRRIARSAVLVLLIFVLLTAAMATYQIVATLFFLPLLVAIIFTEEKESGSRLLKSAIGAAVLFTAAALCFIALHKILLVDFRYFFLAEQQVREAITQERSVSLVSGIADLEVKLAFLGRLISRVLALWFISEHHTEFPLATAFFAAASLVFLALFAWRAANVWRVLALLFTVGCFFGPFALSHNAGNGLYLLERVKVFMQIPFVLFTWALAYRLFSSPTLPLRAVGAAVLTIAALGCSISWMVVLRARVIPNYMELRHIEPRLKDAVRRDVKYFYIIRAEDKHLRATIGARGGEEFARITSFYFPEHMVSAILLEFERKQIPRAIFTVGVDKVGTIPTGGPEKLVLDMRRFP